MPLTPDEQKELKALEKEFAASEPAKPAKKEPRKWGKEDFGAATDPAFEGTLGVGVDLALEAGLPMAAQAVTTPFSPAVQAGAGALSGSLGNILAQWRRMLSGEQEEFSPGQVAEAAAVSAVPFAGPAKTARSIWRSAAEVAKQGAKMGVVSVGGQAIRKGIDEGRLPTAEEAATGAALPVLLGGGAATIGEISGRLQRTSNRVSSVVQDFKGTGITPTPGMVLPESLAVTEQRLATKDVTGDIAGRVDQAYKGLAEGLGNVAPNPQEGAAIFESVSPLLKKIPTAEDELKKLSTAAQKAQAEADAAMAKLVDTKAAAAQKVDTAVVKEAEAISAKAFNENLNSIAENARALSVKSLTGDAVPIDPAIGRDLFVEHVAKPLEAAFTKRAAELYAPVDNLVEGFEVGPILAKAKELSSVSLSGGLPKKAETGINLVQGLLGDNIDNPGAKVSLQLLRNVRDELSNKVKFREFGSSNEERVLKGVINEISDQIDKQAVSALGEEGGTALREANRFYRETRPLFDERGADLLFTSSPSDEFVKKVVSGMEKSGINADEYKNLVTLTDKIAEFNPEVGQAAKQHVNDVIKKSVLFDASYIDPGSLEGNLVIDQDALLKKLQGMAKVPGTLEALGLGSPKAVAEMQALLKKYPDAGSLSAQDWNTLFASPAFQQASQGRPLASNVERTLAAAAAENQMNRAANLQIAGKIKEAETAYTEAIDNLRRVGGDLEVAQKRYQELLTDPVATAFNNPALGQNDFNSFARSLFDPSANKVTNEQVGAIASALKQSKNPEQQELLTRLQERYIADRVAKFRTAPRSSMQAEIPDVQNLELFFNPSGAGDAASEVARARAILTPVQMSELEKFAGVARRLQAYEKLGQAPLPLPSSSIPVVSQIRRGIDVVGDLYRQGKYSLAGWLLADPERLAKATDRVGTLTGFARTYGTEQTIQAIGRHETLERELENR